MAALPEDVEASIINRLHRGEGEDLGGGTESQPDDSAAAGTEPSYGSGTRQGLEQLLENSGGNAN